MSCAEQIDPPEKLPRWQHVAFWLLLLIHAGLLGYSAAVHSPNANEPAHLAAGVSHWEFGRFELYRVNPPLVRMVAAIPTMLLGYESDWSSYQDYPGSRCVFYVGPDFMWANGYRSLWLTTYGRWACMPFSLIGLCICYRWSRELYGGMAGLLSMSLWAFSPSMIAHGSFFTPDAHAASMGLLAGYLFWRWLQQPDWLNCLLAGIGLGLALATKSTWIILFGLWPAIWLIWRLRKLPTRSGVAGPVQPPVVQLITIALVGLNLLHLTYAYDGALPRLGSFEFVGESLKGDTDAPHGNRFRGTWLEQIPVPFPREFVAGIDVQKYDLERPRETYFRGKLYDHGLWYYYLYAIGVKVPIGTQILWGAVLATLVFDKSNPRFVDEFILVLPVLAVIFMVSSQTNYNAHLRYILGAFPFLFVLAGRLSRIVHPAQGLGTISIVLCMGWTTISSLYYFPHSLSYFNESVGGPSNGYRHLANSNIDWGQDLLFLKKWLKQHHISDPINLSYYGLFDPAIAGIQYTNPSLPIVSRKSNSQVNRTSFVSTNFLIGMRFFQWNSYGHPITFGKVKIGRPKTLVTSSLMQADIPTQSSQSQSTKKQTTNHVTE